MTDTAHLSTFALDALALDALPRDEAEYARLHLATCGQCRARAEAGEQFRSHCASRIDQMLVGAQQRRRRWRHGFALRWVAPVLAAAAIAFAFIRLRGHNASAPTEAELGIKGGSPVLEAFARRGQQVFAVKNGAVLAPGDEIRFAVMPQDASYVLIASIDGNNEVSFYYPYNAERSAPLAPNRRTELPGSIVLDAALGPERLVAAFSRAPIHAADLAAELRRQARAPARAALEHVVQVSVTFLKRAPQAIDRTSSDDPARTSNGYRSGEQSR